MSQASPRLRRFVLSELPIEPWRNGAGSTRVIASRHDGGELQWRISVADVVGSQAFSSFTGLDRTAVLINGRGIDLVEGPMCLRMRAVGDQATFPGEWMPTPAPMDGPVQLWNVMTRCGRFNARVRLIGGETMQCQSSVVHVVLVLNGRYSVHPDGDALALRAGEGVVIEQSSPVALHPDGNDAGALITHVLATCQQGQWA